MKELLKNIKVFLSHRFSLFEHKASDLEIIESVRSKVDFKGVNLWALIFAILIASIGLNINSIPIIIGAMLISPIMGPVMGLGLGMEINDLELIKKSGRNLLVATIISILSSTVYFLITPLQQEQPELLARISPSIWDVLIAFFGGGAGMVAASMKEKTNVIPGVAIATALMPPLCTAGFGIATGSSAFFFGAIYLYFINSVFIAISTYLIARYLKMRPSGIRDVEKRRKTTRYMIIIVIVAIVPSILMTVRIVNKSLFEHNARKFVEKEFNYEKTHVVSKSYHYGPELKSINLVLIGKELNATTIDSLNKNLSHYKLTGVKLNIKQGRTVKEHLNLSKIKASILEDILFNNSISSPDMPEYHRQGKHLHDVEVLNELKILYPTIQSFGMNPMTIYHTNTIKADTLKIVFAHFSASIKKNDQGKLERWLQLKYQSPSLKLIVY